MGRIIYKTSITKNEKKSKCKYKSDFSTES